MKKLLLVVLVITMGAFCATAYAEKKPVSLATGLVYKNTGSQYISYDVGEGIPAFQIAVYNEDEQIITYAITSPEGGYISVLPPAQYTLIATLIAGGKTCKKAIDLRWSDRRVDFLESEFTAEEKTENFEARVITADGITGASASVNEVLTLAVNAENPDNEDRPYEWFYMYLQGGLNATLLKTDDDKWAVTDKEDPFKVLYAFGGQHGDTFNILEGETLADYGMSAGDHIVYGHAYLNSAGELKVKTILTLKLY